MELDLYSKRAGTGRGLATLAKGRCTTSKATACWIN
jgi:hypothetical protein